MYELAIPLPSNERDAANLLNVSGGQLTATDVDGGSLTWSGTASGTRKVAPNIAITCCPPMPIVRSDERTIELAIAVRLSAHSSSIAVGCGIDLFDGRLRISPRISLSGKANEPTMTLVPPPAEPDVSADGAAVGSPPRDGPPAPGPRRASSPAEGGGHVAHPVQAGEHVDVDVEQLGGAPADAPAVPKGAGDASASCNSSRARGTRPSAMRWPSSTANRWSCQGKPDDMSV